MSSCRATNANPRKALAELRAHRSRELSGEEVEARVQASGAAMTDITAAELADMEERARGWLPLQGNRDLAINEERMALDVLDLIAEIRAHRQAALSDADKQIVIIALREYVDRDVDHGHEDGNTAAARWALDRLTTEQP